MTDLSRDAVVATLPVIRDRVLLTPVVRVDRALFGLPPGPLVLKLEFLQHSGSFKARGAMANLLLRDVPPAGVIAASGGNHGAAVAWAAASLGVRAEIFVPTVSSPAKIARIRSYGAELAVTGDVYAEALAASEIRADETGALRVPAFDQPETMLGAGSLGLELADQVPEASTVLTAVGGGGLLGGVALSYDGAPVRLVGVEPEGAPTLTRALAAGEPVVAPQGSVAVDSLAPATIGVANFAVLAPRVSSVALVTDEDIRRAQFLLWDRLRVAAEPGGATALAAVASGRVTFERDEVPVVVVSGANVTALPMQA